MELYEAARTKLARAEAKLANARSKAASKRPSTPAEAMEVYEAARMKAAKAEAKLAKALKARAKAMSRTPATPAEAMEVYQSARADAAKAEAKLAKARAKAARQPPPWQPPLANHAPMRFTKAARQPVTPPTAGTAKAAWVGRAVSMADSILFGGGSSAAAPSTARGTPHAAANSASTPGGAHAAAAKSLATPRHVREHLLGAGVTPRTKDKLRLPLDSIKIGSAPLCIDHWLPRDAMSSTRLSSTRGVRGEQLTPLPLAPATASSTSRARRTGADSPLPSSARKRLSSGASWLSELKLRPPKLNDAASRPAPAMSVPSSQCTPRDEHGDKLKPSKLIDYFNRRHSRGGESTARSPTVDEPSVDLALSARNQAWLSVKKGMLSERAALGQTVRL